MPSLALRAKGPAALVVACLVAGCTVTTSASDPGPGAATPAPAADPGTGKAGKTFADPAEAPRYDGRKFTGMQIFDVAGDVYLDEAAFLEALDEERLVFFGEQHESAPIQELQLWTLQRLTERHDDVSLAMEHFQRDEQPVLDGYASGAISSADFLKKSDPWKGYETYWKPLVDHMKSLGKPVFGLNVPDEALEPIYAAYPEKPLDVFNKWGSSFRYASSIAPRPLARWDATYQAYFAASFDYATHGKQMGMSEAEALDYFTDLALIRDETMAYFTAKALSAGGRVMVVAGDWHVQTGLATPDRAARYGGAGTSYVLVTTSPRAAFDAMRTKAVSGRKLARFVLVHD